MSLAPGGGSLGLHKKTGICTKTPYNINVTWLDKKIVNHLYIDQTILYVCQ